MPQSNEVTTSSAVVAVVPGSAKAITFEGEITVREAIELAGVDHSGMQIRLNGDEAHLDDEVENGDRIVLARQVKGN